MAEETSAPFNGAPAEDKKPHPGHGKKDHHKHDGGKGHHGHKHGPKPDKDSLLGLMKTAGHALHHADKAQPDQLFSALDSQEQQELKTLLSKLIASWKEQPAENEDA